MPKKQESNSILKDNWYLILAVAVLLVGGAVMALMPSGKKESGPAGVIGSAGDGVDVVRLTGDEMEEIAAAEDYQGMSKADKDAKSIEDYKAKLAEDPDGEAAAATMSSLAVVYRRQEKYDDAAIVLEELLEKFPDTPNARTALIMLPEIYEAAGDIPMARQTYRRMMEFFPPDSQEHQYAKERYDTL